MNMFWNKHITRLNDRVLRVECCVEGQREIDPTLAVVEPGRFSRVDPLRDQETEVYRNRFLTVRLVQDGKPFSPDNLLIEWDKGGMLRSWQPGQLDHENLGGAPMSMDVAQDALTAEGIQPYDPMAGMNAYRRNVFSLLDPFREWLREHYNIYDTLAWKDEFYHFLEGRPPQIFKTWPEELSETLMALRRFMPGYLSRSGLSLILDDSPAWDSKKQWLAEPPKSHKPQSQALYLIHYGTDFKLGLSMLADLLGPIPPIPEWALGVWFSVYREMCATDYQELKADFDKHDCPLDAMVIDTDWHSHFWHGFDWDRKRFPDPDGFAQWLEREELHAAFNVHPGFIPMDDSRLPEFLETCELKAAPQAKETTYQRGNIGCHPVDLKDSQQAKAWFEIFHRSIERQGCNLWWVDDTHREDAAWLAEIYYRFGQQQSREKIPVLTRNYGLGSHRTTILFTGDTYSQWSVLDQQVLLTPMCANSLMGWVSHDIGGFNNSRQSETEENKPPTDLMVRWTQFGCLSPILRFHSNHGVREPWAFGDEALTVIRAFMQLRKCLMPYLAQLADEAQRTGVAPCRPMYYEFPGEDLAFEHPRQFMLGPALLASPVSREDGIVQTWLPPGRWHHAFEDRVVTGPAVIEEHVPLDIMPLWTREGFEIPFTRKEENEIMSWEIYIPGDALPLASAAGIDPGR